MKECHRQKVVEKKSRAITGTKLTLYSGGKRMNTMRSMTAVCWPRHSWNVGALYEPMRWERTGDDEGGKVDGGEDWKLEIGSWR